MSEIKEAINWYKKTVAANTNEKNIELHTEMWSSWLNKMSIPHIKNSEILNIHDNNDNDVKFKPSIIVPDIELVFASRKTQRDIVDGTINYHSTVPLFIHFDEQQGFSKTKESEAFSNKGYVELGNPILPCRDECNDFDITQHQVSGSYYLKENGDMEIFNLDPMTVSFYFVGVDEYKTPLEERINCNLFGTSYLVPMEFLLEEQSTTGVNTAQFRFDIGTENANRVVFAYYNSIVLGQTSS